MTTYAETDRLRKLARPLYLKLRVLGLDLLVGEDPEIPTGYRVDLTDVKSLSPAHASWIRRRAEEAIPEFLKVLWARWDEDLEAVRREGAV